MGYRNLQGVDLSPEQVALSRQVLEPERVHEGDAIAFLEARPATFTLILGIDIVEHLEKEEVMRFLDAARLALRPSGRLVLQTPNAATPWGSEYRYADFTHEVGLTPNALTRLLTLTGFEAVESREMGPVPHGVPSILRILLWRLIRLGLLAWNYVEMGAPGSGVLTRIMLVSGVAPSSREA
jgi:SAM-dependent methyltransferase